MLGDINFQRKKEFSSPILTTNQYFSNMQNEHTKNVYDFALRLHSQIKRYFNIKIRIYKYCNKNSIIRKK